MLVCISVGIICKLIKVMGKLISVVQSSITPPTVALKLRRETAPISVTI